ncbi:hypothetical protein D3C74_492460 [compost metagenome]
MSSRRGFPLFLKSHVLLQAAADQPLQAKQRRLLQFILLQRLLLQKFPQHFGHLFVLDPAERLCHLKLRT